MERILFNRKAGTLLFFVGAFTLSVHTVLPFLWNLFGIPTPYPLISREGIGAFLPGFTPPIGGLLMLLAGFLYSQDNKR